MTWWRRLFGRSEVEKQPLQPLIFKDGEAFFAIECKYGSTDIVQGKHIVALVLDAREHAGAKRAIKTNSDGSQLAMIRIASSDGGWITAASTASGGAASLDVGDLVAWIPLSHLEQPLTHDPRSIWAGLIVAKVAPEYDGKQLRVLERY